ncbi:hypothetical protein C5167_048916 [Papaver somniferum]|uniref:Uncharacterized protein n=1 Tax=Papaver somniferum TaxID=3469 RepID=A0A4Y7KM11_PAPSO|nr:hypothetical protein C5167_048916 [Papaver somniferum]
MPLEAPKVLIGLLIGALQIQSNLRW